MCCDLAAFGSPQVSAYALSYSSEAGYALERMCSEKREVRVGFLCVLEGFVL